MIISGKTMDDRLASVAKRLSNGQVEMMDWDCTAHMIVEHSYLQQRSSTDPYFPNRPYLRFIGKTHRLNGELCNEPFAVDFGEDSIPMDVIYEFSNKELSDMVMKGLFEHGFDTPDTFDNCEIFVPVEASLMSVDPEYEELPPIFFANVKNRREVVIDTERSGYQFGEYFEAPPYEMHKRDAYEGHFEPHVEEVPKRILKDVEQLSLLDEFEDQFEGEAIEIEEVDPIEESVERISEKVDEKLERKFEPEEELTNAFEENQKTEEDSVEEDFEMPKRTPQVFVEEKEDEHEGMDY